MSVSATTYITNLDGVTTVGGIIAAKGTHNKYIICIHAHTHTQADTHCMYIYVGILLYIWVTHTFITNTVCTCAAH